MSVLKTRAVPSLVQFAGGADENANPGSDGTTTSNEAGLPVDDVAFLAVKGLMMGANSRNDPGQPWSSSSGIASGSADFSWMK